MLNCPATNNTCPARVRSGRCRETGRFGRSIGVAGDSEPQRKKPGIPAAAGTPGSSPYTSADLTYQSCDALGPSDPPKIAIRRLLQDPSVQQLQDRFVHPIFVLLRR